MKYSYLSTEPKSNQVLRQNYQYKGNERQKNKLSSIMRNNQ
jgi:hypothetical protein